MLEEVRRFQEGKTGKAPDDPRYGIQIDTVRLMIQWAIIILSAGGILLVLGDRKEKIKYAN